MATNFTLVIEGIAGETQNMHYADENGIDIHAWSWGMTQSGTTHEGPGAGSGKVHVQDISFTKYVDNSSPDFIKACATGKHIPKATLHVRKADGDQSLEYLTIEMNTVLVSAYTTGGSADGLDRVQENISLNFRNFHVNYVKQESAGSGAGENDVTFDIARNELT